MAEPYLLFLSSLFKMQQQEDSSLVQNRFSDTLRQAMRTIINDILQRRKTISKTSNRGIQKFLSEYINYLESKLMNSANSEEEYSNPRDLEVRIQYLKKEVREKWSRFRAMRFSDRLSALPDSLITQILLFLPTKDSIKTSFLSKRFRDLWLQVPGLELHSHEPLAIKNFIATFLEINRDSRLQRFKITYDDGGMTVYHHGISEFIAGVINRGVQKLDLGTVLKRPPLTKDLIPVNIYKSNTLVSLKLANVGVPNPPEFVVSLPCLKTMHLEDAISEDSLLIEKLISGCPVLEDLMVFRVFDDNVPILRVRSQCLKRFCVKFGRYGSVFGIEYAVEVDAPGLKYMNFRDDHSDRVVVKNLSSLFMIDIDTQFSVVLGTANTLQMKKAIISDFLKGVSSVRHMIISQPTLEVLYSCMEHGPFTKFLNLTRLESSFCTVLLQNLPHFLEGFPKLKHFTLYLLYLKDSEPENLELIAVPQCLLRTLECVEIKEVATVEKAGKKRARYIKRTKVSKHKKKIWTELVRYILENSLVLKKLVLRFSSETNSVLEISEALPTFTIVLPVVKSPII